MTDDTPPHGSAGNPRHQLPIGGSQECLLCPVCVFLQAMSQSRPEVTQHLLAAARELTLALRAVVDSQVEAHERAAAGASRFERINVD